MSSILPLVTIILPIRNEAPYIERCLSALLAQDYPAERQEIFIVDGMSTDRTREILSKFQKHQAIILLDNPEGIVPTALNRALRKAKGEIIVRVDGHTVIAPDYVRQCVVALTETQAANVGGKMNAISNNFVGRTVAHALSTPFGVGGARFHYSDMQDWVDTVYMGAWPRKIFEEVGYFDEELVRNQDDEFNYRIRKWGGKILLSPKIQSEYYCRSSLHSLWRQYFQYGYWKVRVLQKHPRQMSLRQFVPPVFVAAMVLPLPFMFLFPQLIPPYFLVPVFYLLANLSASLVAASRWGWQYLPLLPLVYGILHIAYGTGFLAGLVKFANRWGDKTGHVPPHVAPADA